MSDATHEADAGGKRRVLVVALLAVSALALGLLVVRPLLAGPDPMAEDTPGVQAAGDAAAVPEPAEDAPPAGDDADADGTRDPFSQIVSGNAAGGGAEGDEQTPVEVQQPPAPSDAVAEPTADAPPAQAPAPEAPADGSAPGFELPSSSVTVVMFGVLAGEDHPRALVGVNGRGFKVRVDDLVLDIRVVAIDGRCADFERGGETFKLCEDEEVTK
jgi:hypothetical protein